MNRRRLLASALAGAALPVLGPAVRAELVIDVRRGTFQPIPIAVLDFGGDPELGPRISGIVASNLVRSGYFTLVEKERGPAAAFDAAPAFDPWRQAGAQGLVTGRVARDGSGRVLAEFRLWDVIAGAQIDGRRFGTDPASSRRLGHIVADAVYAKITGVGGFFDTRIAFVDESGPKERRRKRLAVMDQDGANVRYLTSGEGSVVSPRYSPRTQQIAYMAQSSGRQPRVEVIDLETGGRQAVGADLGDMSSSPRFTPDGRRLLIGLQEGGNSNLFAVDLSSKATTRLTTGAAIDTSPSPSPDGGQIAFESDRGGKQQIYVMGADGSGAKRISFGEGSYSQPAWSPRGDLIAFTKQRPSGFAIGVMRPDGSGERILTEGFHNEGPTWAPNGQYLVIFRDPGGQSGGKLFMIDVTGRVEQPVPTPSFASDPTWSPLLSEGRS